MRFYSTLLERVKNIVPIFFKSRLNWNWELAVGYHGLCSIKVEIFFKGRLDSIPTPSPSLKIQIMGGKVCLTSKGKTLLDVVNKILKTTKLLSSPINVLPYCLKQTFPPIIWIFNEGEGDGIESNLPFKIFPTLLFVIIGKQETLESDNSFSGPYYSVPCFWVGRLLGS